MLNILEIGCGKGRYSEYLRRKYRGKTYGIDISSSSIDYAKRNYPKVYFDVMDTEQLIYNDKQFDMIFAIDVLEHVEDLKQTLVEIKRVAKDNSKLVINVPAPDSEQWLAKIRPTYAEEMHHVRIFKDTELEDMLNILGFKLKLKKLQGFSDHLILYYLMTRKNTKGDNQLGIGNWRDTWTGRILFSCHAFTKPNLVFESWLKYIPIWVVGIPIGWFVNFLGNHYMPKSVYYEFKKLSNNG